MFASRYIYEIIDNKDDARSCAQLLAEEFCAHNPITLFDQLEPTYFYETCAWPLVKDMYTEHLSFLVRLRSTGEIIGAITAGDLYLEHQRKHLSADVHSPKPIAVSDLLEEMDDLFVTRDFGQELKPNMVLHVQLGAIRTEYSRKGIASEMRKLVAKNAHDKRGFQYLLVQSTNSVTRHIYVNKMNGKEVTLIDPTAWQWKKNGDDKETYPYQDYKGGVIPNILVKL